MMRVGTDTDKAMGIRITLEESKAELAFELRECEKKRKEMKR